MSAVDMHVVPRADHITHDTGAEPSCVCGPQLELVETDQGDRWIAVHNALRDDETPTSLLRAARG